MRDYAKPLRSVFLVGFLLTLALSLTSYVDSSFLGLFVNIKTIGLLFALGSLASILLLSLLPKALSRLGVRNVFHLNSLLYLLSILIMINTGSPALFKLFFILYVASGVGIYFAIDVLIEHFSQKSSTGNVRGFYLAIYNLAFLLGPLLAGIILKNNPFSLVYLLSGIIMIIMGFIYIKDLDQVNFGYGYHQKNFFQSLHRIWNNKNLLFIHLLSLSLYFFFSWMAIYTPIYLNQFIGFNWAEIGALFAVMHIPYVAIDSPLGKLLDRVSGEKKAIIMGLSIMAVGSMLLGLTIEKNFGLWAFMLSLTRIGASFVQVGTESFFFKHIGGKDSGLIATFREASPIAYILGPLLATLFLSLTEYKNLFIILGVIMLLTIVFALNIQEKNEKTRISHSHQ